MRSLRLVMALFACATVTAAPHAQPASVCSGAVAVDPGLPAYDPQPFELPNDAAFVEPDGTIIVVGYNDMRDMLKQMASSFIAAHPQVRLRFDLPGTRFAPAALAKGASALAPMGALFTPSQLDEYRTLTSSEPLAVRVAHASLDPQALSGPLAVFVHRDNPLRTLTLAQVAKVFAGDFTTWRDLGLKGEWGERSIDAFGLQPGTALGLEMQLAVLSDRPFGSRVTGLAQSAELVDKVAADRFAMGFAAAMRATPGVRALAIAPDEHAEPIAPTCEDIIADRYPLDRHLLIYLRRPVTPFAREFVRLVLSRDGQQAVAASPQHYLPLSAHDAANELRKLGP